MVQHGWLHMSVNSHNDDFKKFVDTLVVALRLIEKSESPRARSGTSTRSRSERATCPRKDAPTSGWAFRSTKTMPSVRATS